MRALSTRSATRKPPPRVRPTGGLFYAEGGMRVVATVLAVLVLSLPLSACSSTTHRVISGTFCALTAYQLYRDVKAHRMGWAAFQAVLAAHNCRQAFRRP